MLSVISGTETDYNKTKCGLVLYVSKMTLH